MQKNLIMNQKNFKYNCIAEAMVIPKLLILVQKDAAMAPALRVIGNISSADHKICEMQIVENNWFFKGILLC